MFSPLNALTSTTKTIFTQPHKHSASPQIHLIGAIRLGAPLHPGRVSAAPGQGSGSLQPDGRGRAPEHLAPLQDSAGLPASPAGTALPEHHHRLPQAPACRLHHRTKLRLPAASQAIPLQRGARGGRPQEATSVTDVGGWRGDRLVWGAPSAIDRGQSCLLRTMSLFFFEFQFQELDRRPAFECHKYRHQGLKSLSQKASTCSPL